MNETGYLLMWLEAPLQSWGFDSRFSRRNCLEFPTKSALLGMLCCAMGKGGEQKEWLAAMAPLKTTVVAYARRHSVQETPCALLRDFHMVGAGYNEDHPFEKLMQPRTVDGTKPVGGGAKLTYRYYLQDAYFAAVLEIAKEQSESLSQALLYPVWDLFLGRKCCAPTDFIYRGFFENEEQALSHASAIAESKSLKKKFKVVDGQWNKEGEVFTLNDVPLQFGECKQYSQRYVTVVRS